MKITLAAFVLLISITINAQQQSENPTSPVIVAKIALGETVLFEDAAISFKKVIEDSRCPKDVDCIWAGQARVLIAVKTNGISTEKELIFHGSNFGTAHENTLFFTETKTYIGYRLSPYPVSAVSPEKRNYTLEVYLK